MYKVFINDSSLSFTISPSISESDNLPFEVDFDFESLIAEIEVVKEARHLCIYHENLDQLWDSFTKFFKIIEAAGGIVNNEQGQILLIFRLGCWDLPKGKIELGEAKKEAAVREVEEECGIEDLKILRELPNTYHMYTLKGKKILKYTYWYEMETSFSGRLTPQLEEDIIEAKWVERKDLVNYIPKTYSSIGELLNFYLKN